MRVRTLAVLSLLMLVVAARPASAGGGGHGVCAGFTRGAEISMLDACFQGTAHFVDRGSILTVTNNGQTAHDFTAADGSFASGQLEPGQRFEVTLDHGGAIPFYCTLHGNATGSGMAGVLFVGESAVPDRVPGTVALDPVRARSTNALVGEGVKNTTPVATTTVTDTVPSYLAAGALLMSSVALVVVIALVRPPRRERGAAGRT